MSITLARLSPAPAQPDTDADAFQKPMWLPLRAALIVIVLTTLGVAGWGGITTIDSAAVATGNFVVELNRRVVQHLEGGIVGEVLVREGDFVQQGQPLLRLDITRARAQLTTIRDDIDRTRVREAALIAERDEAANPTFPADILARQGDEKVAEILATQQNEFVARRASLQGQIEILTQRMVQLRSQIEGLRVRVRANDRQIVLVRREITMVEILVRQGLERQARLLGLQREEARLLGEKGEAIENIAKTEQTISETEMQRVQALRTRQEDVAKDIRETQSRLFELREREVAAADQLTRLDIVAPESGIVMDLRFTATGGVIAPGAQVATIVPREERLVMEAQVSPMEVDTLRVGMHATIRLSHAGARWTPVIDGTLERISPDRRVDEKTGMSYFVVRVGVSPEEMQRHPGLRLLSGMQGEVLIRRGERSVASYLIRPIMDRFSKALREF